MNILLSYPRSGNTWLRYCLETLSGQKTTGYLNGRDIEKGVLETNRGKPTLMVKKHDTINIKNNKNNKLILIVRDYKECLVRHKGGKYSIIDNAPEPETNKKNYLKLLEFYERFEGKKLLVYYEDLILDLKPQLKKCVELLDVGVKEDTLNDFMMNLETHREKSLGLYKFSKTKGDLNIKHSDVFNENEKYNQVQFLMKNI